MNEVRILPTQRLGRSFLPAELLPPGKDEYYLRNEQSSRPAESWRHLRADEIEALVKNANTCDDWDRFLVSDPFDPRLIKNSEFSGLVRLGRLERVILEHHDLQMPAGITDSVVISCDLGDNVGDPQRPLSLALHCRRPRDPAEHRRDEHDESRQVRQRDRQAGRSRRKSASGSTW